MNVNFLAALARVIACVLVLSAPLAAHGAEKSYGQFRPMVPGTGLPVPNVGDDFEEEAWDWTPYYPKSSQDIDKQQRGPGGESKNGRWYEGIKRGAPDLIKRVPAPKGAVEGSTSALLLQTRNSGIPGRPSYTFQQDDFVCDVHERLGGAIPVSQQPSAVVRVYFPPLDKWERRTGPTFGVRLALDTMHSRPDEEAGFPKGGWHRGTYWPGFFVQFHPKSQSVDHDYIQLVIRSDEYGRDYQGPYIDQLGWWTFGMSVTADGAVHYYAHAGVEPLTEEDHIASHFPYGFRAQHMKTAFFNVINQDDGRTVSTPWLIDDCQVSFVPKNYDPRLAAKPKNAAPAEKTTTEPAKTKPAAEPAPLSRATADHQKDMDRTAATAPTPIAGEGTTPPATAPKTLGPDPVSSRRTDVERK